MKTLKFFFVFSFIFCLCSIVNAQDHMIYNTGDIKWMDAAPPMPPTAKVAVLEGDPSKEGEFTMRAKLPAGFKIPPHWHPATEHVTVISGMFYLGFGDKYDETNGTAISPGGMAIMMPKHHHYAWTNEETVIQLNGIGPWGLVYVNPEDDPANKK